jgi:hypothetical protein
LDEGIFPPEVILAELVAVAPRPRSYKKWQKVLDEMTMYLSLIPCSNCHVLVDPAIAEHRGSERDVQISGMLCPDCTQICKDREARKSLICERLWKRRREFRQVENMPWHLKKLHIYS